MVVFLYVQKFTQHIEHVAFVWNINRGTTWK